MKPVGGPGFAEQIHGLSSNEQAFPTQDKIMNATMVRVGWPANCY